MDIWGTVGSRRAIRAPIRYCFNHLRSNHSKAQDPVNDIRILVKDFQNIREKYDAPKYPVVLCHGLFGWDSITPKIPYLPRLDYWRGIKQALELKGIKVITAKVSPIASIQNRAEALYDSILHQLNPTPGSPVNVNLIGHSMGGLDARYFTSILKPDMIHVKSLTTISTPHRGTSFADFGFNTLGPKHVSRIYKLLPILGIDEPPDGFSQLTTNYLKNEFNPQVLDNPHTKYFSYGARFSPGYFHVFRKSWSIIKKEEGDNDGLVSVNSAQWGTYQGTLENCSHLNLINWTNIIQNYWWKITGQTPSFNAIALYLHIADMLAQEGM